MPTKYTPGEQSTHLCECGCGQPTEPMPFTHKARGWVKGQPYRYVRGHNRRRPAEDRFWENVNKNAENGCWEWTGYCNELGYGRIYIEGQNVYVHRYSYELQNGPVPEDLCVLHNCPGGDNPRCCNPAHLWLGTKADNSLDMVRKGRQAKGSTKRDAKLDENKVVEIRLRYQRENITFKALALEYGVDSETIASVIYRRTWRDIP